MKSIVVGTAGHIDHGKSALVRALTGTDPDRLKEEKARGITIDLGFASVNLGGVNVAFVDVPGHERFVKNMLAGAGGIDLVVLVVAADESVMPQTREHFDICRLLQVPAGLVALTKADLVDAETLELVKIEVRQLLSGSFLRDAPIVAVSSKTGEGLDAIRTALVDLASRAVERRADGPARLPIDRVFSMKGFGTVVTGTLTSGRIGVDQEFVVQPGRLSAKVRGVQVHGAKRPEAVAGERTAVNLGGVDKEQIARGQSLVTPNRFEETRLADAAIELLPGAKKLPHGARVRFHQGTAEILARVGVIGPATSEGVGVAPGSREYVRLRLEKPAVLARGDRYVLRSYSPAMTIAGGVILDPRPARVPIRSQATKDHARRLDVVSCTETREDAELRAAAVMIEDMGRLGFPVSALVSRAGIDPSDVDARVDALVKSGRAVQAGGVLVAPATVDTLKSAIHDALTEHHQSQPLMDGLPREELRERVFRRGHQSVFDRTLTALADAGVLTVRDRVGLAGHRPKLSPEEERARTAIERAFRDAGLKPPEASAAASGLQPAVADRMLKLLQRQKVLVKVDTLLFHDEALARLKSEVKAFGASTRGSGRLDVATFKEKFGVTRKFAIPLLEYLDRERVTRRVGDARIVL